MSADHEQVYPSRMSERAFYASAAMLVFLTYFLVFALNGGGIVENASASLRNLLPLLLLAAGVRPILLRYVKPLPPLPQLAAHVGLGLIFAGLWYWLLMVMIGIAYGDAFTRFTVRPFFDDPAFAWQLLQGAAIYTALAAITFLRAQPPEPPAGPPQLPQALPESKEPALRRYFIRQGEEILPVDVAEIVTIAGADDYAEIATMDGRHLVRLTLAELETSLDGRGFIRVHRSRIVNVDRVMRAEPAGGGRMLLHMENGELIQTSRAGARLLRDRVI